MFVFYCFANGLQSFPIYSGPFRVWQLADIVYICMPTFIDERVSLDMHTLTLMLIFSYDLLKFQNCSIFYNFILFKKTYCYVFDLWFNCLSMQLLDFLVFTFVLKKPYFWICHTYYLINITLNGSGYIGKDWKPFAKQ